MEIPEKATDAAREVPSEATFHYIKSNDFRVIHCDGAFGGSSPNGKFIHMALFSERLPIPIQITNSVDDAGKIGEEKSRVAREGIVREVAVDVVMSQETAITMAHWLLKQVKTQRDLFLEAMAGEHEKDSPAANTPQSSPRQGKTRRKK